MKKLEEATAYLKANIQIEKNEINTLIDKEMTTDECFSCEILEHQIRQKTYEDVLMFIKSSTIKEEMKVDKSTKNKFPNYDKEGNYHTTYQCPNCDCTIHLDWHEKKNYCPECGIKLDWSDTDET